MIHRIRAAVLIFNQDSLLLVKHVDPISGFTWWIPPGGGLEDGDESILDCAVREVYEESGLHVTPSRPVYFREFQERKAGVRHFEIYFTAESCRGEPSTENIAGNGPDEEFIKEVSWISRREISNLTVFPEYFKDGLWKDYQKGFPGIIFLGSFQD